MFKLIGIFIAVLLMTVKINAQVKYDFVSVFSELISPPVNCEEASVLFPLDSNQKMVSAGINITEQETKLVKIQTEITNALNAFKSSTEMPKLPPGAGPPGGMPPKDGGINSDVISDVKEIMDKRIKASENITINMNIYKKEILKNQEELNIKLKKTKQTEEDKRLEYVNEFLTNTKTIYDKNYSIILKNVTDMVNTFNKDKNSAESKIPFLKTGMLKFESELITTALLLFKITKQISEAGSMFYYGLK